MLPAEVTCDREGACARRRGTRWVVGAILAIAFLLRVGGAVYWQQQADREGRLFRWGDSHSYWVLAGQVARGEPYQYGSPHAQIFRAPLYPIFLAPFTLISDQRAGVIAARLAGAVVGSLMLLILMELARRVHRARGPVIPVVVGGMGAVYPAAIGMSVMVLSEALFMPWMLLYLLGWLRSWQALTPRSRYRWALLTGVFWGLGVLTRPSWLLFPVMHGAVGLLGGPSRRRQLALFAVICSTFSITMMPWWVRNYRVAGRFVPTTLQVGPSLYDGLHPGATGASDEGMEFMRRLYAAEVGRQENVGDKARDTLEYRLNRRAMHEALRWARQNPREVLRLAILKFRRTWAWWPEGGEIGAAPVGLVLSVASFAVLLLAIIESLLAVRQWHWGYTLCWLPCIYFTALHMVFVGSVRYREPAVVVLMVLAGGCVARGYRWVIDWMQGSSIADSPSRRETEV
ncbi:MAG: hypothetical protein KatS3mg111_0716 [Pirellulaceae bacterium]|nr:MAG: hypothetical protein KatS3mg111_0716 [Pirellulaceae bacterium]